MDGVPSLRRTNMKYYVVVGVWRESGEQEVINGFYSRKDALEEKDCHKHEYKKLRVIPIDDTAEAMGRLIVELRGSP
jgi:hypothetical protein